jgi:hypothetical protein
MLALRSGPPSSGTQNYWRCLCDECGEAVTKTIRMWIGFSTSIQSTWLTTYGWGVGGCSGQKRLDSARLLGLLHTVDIGTAAIAVIEARVYGNPIPVTSRLGQGAFPRGVTDAYER